MSESHELSLAQESALIYFVKFHTRQEICDALGIAQSTYSTWMANPVFNKKVKEIRDDLLQDALDTLKSLGLEAVKMIATVMRNEDAGPAVQLKAANDILTYLIRWKELEDIEVRLRLAEKIQNNNKP